MKVQFITEPLIDVLEQEARVRPGADLKVVVAFAREGGVSWLGQVQGHLGTQVQVVTGVNHGGTTADALVALLDMGCRVWVFYKHPLQTFHPKIFRFGPTSKQSVELLIVGSSNLTHGGLVTNYEASLGLWFKATDLDAKGVIADFDTAWNEWTTSEFSFEVKGTGEVGQLYDLGLVDTEKRAHQRGVWTPRRRNRSAEELPTSPPLRRRRPARAAVDLAFLGLAAPPTGAVAAPAPAPSVAPFQFFVRTLTPNDVAKLSEAQVGTFEPDLGLKTRDQDPEFWGWPDRYKTVTQPGGGKRLQWTAVIALSSSTTAAPVRAQLVIWVRPPRPKHLAEHRLSFQPIPDVRTAVPSAFDRESLLVVEKAEAGSGLDYRVKLLEDTDPGFKDYASYLTTTRARHRNGYGPRESAAENQ